MKNADGPHFPLYIFGISFIKQKRLAARQIWSKLHETFFGGYSGIYPALGRSPERLVNIVEIRVTLVSALFTTNICNMFCDSVIFITVIKSQIRLLHFMLTRLYTRAVLVERQSYAGKLSSARDIWHQTQSFHALTIL